MNRKKVTAIILLSVLLVLLLIPLPVAFTDGGSTGYFAVLWQVMKVRELPYADGTGRSGTRVTLLLGLITIYDDTDRETEPQAATEPCDTPAPEKPVIYLYPETETEVCVRLDYDGELTCTYPAYQDGWTVTAAPDGTLTDAAGQTYRYLYWEGRGPAAYDFSRGFCVRGTDTAAFLETALAELGLTRAEANEFIVYWLPRLQDQPWNLIAFQHEAYTQTARLDVTPAPDTLIRVFMAVKPLTAPVQIETQDLTAPARTGFTVVEWGGAVD